MRLIVNDHEYYEVTGKRWPLLSLLWEVVKHRTWHWWRGDGWTD